MNQTYYPWGGEFTACNDTSCIAVVLLNISYTPSDSVALYGHLKTENIGIEKIVANVISNPYIRYILICGNEIRGHNSGHSLLCLHQYGIDENNRIIQAKGAIPYIENLDRNAIHRFQSQIQIINCLEVTDTNMLDETIATYTKKPVCSFGDSYIAIQIKPQTTATLDDKRALHSKILIDYKGKITKRR